MCRFRKDISCDSSVTLGVKVSPETEKTDVVKDILKHHRSSHRPGIHQSLHLNKSIFYKLFFTLSRLKGPQKILDTIRGFETTLCRQYHYSPYHHVRMPEGYVGGSWESKFTAAVSNYSSIIISVMLIVGYTTITPKWESE